MKFGDALETCKQGGKIFRIGWNGNKVPPIVPPYPLYIPTERVEYVEALDLTYILLSDNNVAVCDGCCYELVKTHKWSSSGAYAFITDNQNNDTIKLHNAVYGVIPDGYIVDHINGDGFDCRSINLRLATVKENNANRKSKKGTSKYKGVSFDTSRNKWIASIQINGQTKHLGRFGDEVCAAETYDKAAWNAYGQYAKLNFPNTSFEPRMFVVYQKGYPDGIPCNMQTAKAWGMNEGDLFKCEPYLQIKMVNGSHAMWVPSINDILAEDWEVVR